MKTALPKGASRPAAGGIFKTMNKLREITVATGQGKKHMQMIRHNAVTVYESAKFPGFGNGLFYGLGCAWFDKCRVFFVCADSDEIRTSRLAVIKTLQAQRLSTGQSFLSIIGHNVCRGEYATLRSAYQVILVELQSMRFLLD